MAACAVTISRLDCGSPSNPHTWPNAYAGVCRRPQLWLTLPNHPVSSTRVSPTATVPSKRASGWRTWVFAVGNRARYARSVSSLTAGSSPGVIRRSHVAPGTEPRAETSSIVVSAMRPDHGSDR